jgi:hypothetical protein
MPRIDRKNFKSFFQAATPEAVDFLEKTLNLDPDYRLNLNFFRIGIT